jgi:hypothetical protein
MVVEVDFMVVAADSTEEAEGSTVVASTEAEDLAEDFTAAGVFAEAEGLGVDSAAGHERMAAEGFEAEEDSHREAIAVQDLADMDSATGVAWDVASEAPAARSADATLSWMATGIPLEAADARGVPLERRDLEMRRRRVAPGVRLEGRAVISPETHARFLQAADFRVLAAFAEEILELGILGTGEAIRSQATDSGETHLARLAGRSAEGLRVEVLTEASETSGDLIADGGVVMAGVVTVGAATVVTVGVVTVGAGSVGAGG